MKVSCVIGAYCGERFIGEQIGSIFAQTRPVDEIVVCDDSPNDATELAVRRLPVPNGVELRYFRNTHTLGVARNFEKALSLASGEILFLCDQDDFWLPQKVETVLCGFDAAPACDGFFSNSRIVDAELRPLGRDLFSVRGFSMEEQRGFAETDQLMLFLRKSVGSCHNMALRRRALAYLLPFPELPGLYADTFLGFGVAAFSRWAMTPAELTHYRQHGGNTSDPLGTSFLRRLSAARAAVKRDALDGYRNCADALLARRPGPEAARLLAAYRAYLSRRSSRAGTLLAAIKGEHARFGSGFRSLAVDLFLR